MAENPSPKNNGETLVYSGIAIFLAASLIGALGVLVVMKSAPTPGDATAADATKVLVIGVLSIGIGAWLGFVGALLGSIGAIRWGVSLVLEPALDKLNAKLDEPAPLLKSINERLLISDAAKRITYRGEDLEALRHAIRDDIAQGKFDTALALVQEMANTYGYKAEAEHFKEEIAEAKLAVVEREVERGMEEINAAITEADWDKVATFANKLRRTFPEHASCKDLPEYIREKKIEHKGNLEREFLKAAERDDVARAESLLKELDKYLTPEEAEPFRETARAVFGKKKQNLGVRFKLAVGDKDWAQAITVGEEIIRDFPNSKMAEEVHGMLAVLRDRAKTAQATEAQN